jgi:cellulose 1,4-beta-cellobiosidase
VNAIGESANSAQVSATPTAGSVPPVPTGLSVTDDNNHAVLSWSASTGATSYKVKRATVSGGPYTVIATPTATAYTDTTVVSGTYYYVVSAVNAVGESANSAQVSYVPGG